MIRHTLALLAALALSLPALAQDDYKAQTAADPTIAVTKLGHLLNPLKADQLVVEADAWLDVLAAKNTEISQKRIESGSGTDTSDVTKLVAEQSHIVERLDAVLDALKARGGDATSYEQYIAASTGVKIDASDAAGMVNLAKDWLISPDGGIKWGLNIVKFLVTLIVFRILSRILGSITRKAISRAKGTSELLRDFFVNTVTKVTFFIGLVIAVGFIGVDPTPFLAAIGAAGFVIGFALQGTLSNFACGIMLLIYRPYDIGEVVTVAGTTGKVDAMTLVSTTLRLPDNQTVVIPNNSIWGGVITNITGQSTRRVDMVFGCGYSDDLKKVQQVLEEIVRAHPKVHAEPAPVVKLHELADSSVNFIVRPWTNTADYWDVFWDVTSQVKERFDAAGLNIPFPQRDVHLHQVKD